MSSVGEAGEGDGVDDAKGLGLLLVDHLRLLQFVPAGKQPQFSHTVHRQAHQGIYMGQQELLLPPSPLGKGWSPKGRTCEATSEIGIWDFGVHRQMLIRTLDNRV